MKHPLDIHESVFILETCINKAAPGRCQSELGGRPVLRHLITSAPSYHPVSIHPWAKEAPHSPWHPSPWCSHSVKCYLAVLLLLLLLFCFVLFRVRKKSS